MKRSTGWVWIGVIGGIVLLCIAAYAVKPPPLEQINACSSDADCALVRSGVCGGAEAIQARQAPLWNFIRAIQRLRLPLAVCTPMFPDAWYQARCINTRCNAFMTRQHAKLIFSQPPALNQPVKLQFTLRTFDDLPGARAWVRIPPGIELLDGPLEWQGDLPKDSERSLDLTVRAVEPGFYLIEAGLFSPETDRLSLSDEVQVEVDETGAVFPGKALKHWDQRLAYPLPQNAALMQTELLVAPKPVPGGEFELILRATPLADMLAERAVQITQGVPREGLRVRSVQYPPGGEGHQAGEMINWQGSAARGQTLELRARLQVLESGQGRLLAILHGETGGDDPRQVTDTWIAEVYIGEKQGSVNIYQP